MLHNANESMLVLVDLQQRLMPSIFEGERVIKEAFAWRTLLESLRFR